VELEEEYLIALQTVLLVNHQNWLRAYDPVCCVPAADVSNVLAELVNQFLERAFPSALPCSGASHVDAQVLPITVSDQQHIKVKRLTDCEL
jgi:hypothetical protein